MSNISILLPEHGHSSSPLPRIIQPKQAGAMNHTPLTHNASPENNIASDASSRIGSQAGTNFAQHLEKQQDKQQQQANFPLRPGLPFDPQPLATPPGQPEQPPARPPGQPEDELSRPPGQPEQSPGKTPSQPGEQPQGAPLRPGLQSDPQPLATPPGQPEQPPARPSGQSEKHPLSPGQSTTDSSLFPSHRLPSDQMHDLPSRDNAISFFGRAEYTASASQSYAATTHMERLHWPSFPFKI